MKNNGQYREPELLAQTLSTVNAAALSELAQALAYYGDAVRHEADAGSHNGDPGKRLLRALSQLHALLEAKSDTLAAAVGRSGRSREAADGTAGGGAGDPLTLLRSHVASLGQKLSCTPERSPAAAESGASHNRDAVRKRTGRKADGLYLTKGRFIKKKRANRRRR